jgi:tetratricopeptide (TPR) repeat protein
LNGTSKNSDPSGEARESAEYNLAIQHHQNFELDRAKRLYKKVLTKWPEFPDAHFNMAALQRTVGEFDDALGTYERLIALVPNHARAHRGLALLKKFTPNDPQIVEMEKFHALSETTTDRKVFAFALAKAFDDIAQYEKAFTYLLEANRLHRRSIDFSLESKAKYFNQLRQCFDLSFVEHFTEHRMSESGLILIVGMPRSGTTLVNAILSSHSKVYDAGETIHLAKLFEGLVTASGELSRSAFLKLHRDEYVKRMRDYIEKIFENAGDADYVVDKLPHNFEFLGLVLTFLPNTKVIHCMRQPLDNCLSIFQQFFGAPIKYAYDLGEVSQFYCLYRELMEHWRAVFGDRILDMQYENVVCDNGSSVRQLLAYCGLSFEKACLSHHKNIGAVNTASSVQVRERINDRSIDKWKRYENYLGSLMNVLRRNGAL